MTSDTPTLTFHGVAITVNGGSPADTEPLIGCATDWGFACGKEALEFYGQPRRSDLPRLVRGMEALRIGPAVAFVEPPASTRPLVLVQSDRGVFYERHHRAWVGSWKDFFGGVDWDYWESRRDPKCHNCKMHSGFEASVVRKLGERVGDVWTMARWQLENIRGAGRRAA